RGRDLARLRHRAVRFDAVALARCNARMVAGVLAAHGAMRAAGCEARIPAASGNTTAPGQLDSAPERAGPPAPEGRKYQPRQTRKAEGGMTLRQAATPFRFASIRRSNSCITRR